MKYYVISKREELNSKYYLMLPIIKYRFKFIANFFCFYMNIFDKNKQFRVKEIVLCQKNPTPKELLEYGLLIRK